jgi:peptide/nickel transport system substrate-binding protein
VFCVLGFAGASGRSHVGRAERSSVGVIPEVQDLFDRQARELNRGKREEMLHQIQKVLHDRTVFAPIWENGFIRGVGPRVEEPALALIPFYPYSAPYEDLRLKP